MFQIEDSEKAADQTPISGGGQAKLKPKRRKSLPLMVKSDSKKSAQNLAEYL